MGAFHSKHFTLEKIKEGIYAAIAKPGGGSVGNAGFVDLGDQTIVFDTFNTPQAAEDLKSMAEKITNRRVTRVVNVIGMETISVVIRLLKKVSLFQAS